MDKRIVVIVALMIGIAAAMFMYRKPPGPKGIAPDSLEAVKAADVRRLNEGADSDPEMAKSLKRMAFQDPAKAQEYARRFVGHTSVTIRAAAFETAGMFSGEEWDGYVQQGLTEKETEIRIGTLRGIARQPSPERNQWIDRMLAGKNVDPVERLWALYAGTRAEPEEKKRKQREGELVAQLKKVDRETQSEMLIELYKTWPDRKELVPFAETVVRAGQETQDLIPGFQYLRAYASDNLAAVLNASSRWPDSRYFLINVADFLKERCPGDWEAIAAKASKHQKADAEINGKLEKIDCK
jgi:hypothetical protein